MLREAAAIGTEMGENAGRYMSGGELVPDDVIIGVAEERLSMVDALPGFILDGFPRTVPQAEALEEMLERRKAPLTTVVAMEVDVEKVVQRLRGRRICPSCGASFNVETAPPRDPNRCDVCGQGLVVREDDRPESVRERLRVYTEKTLPLVQFYEKRGLLRRVDATGAIEDVFAELRRVLD